MLSRSYMIFSIIVCTVLFLEKINSEENIVDTDGFLQLEEEIPRDAPTLEKAYFNKMLHKNIRDANLTTLVGWLEWTHEIRDHLVEKQEKVRNNEKVEVDGVVLEGDRDDLIARFDKALAFIDRYTYYLEKELREPKKDWNYPKEDEKV